MVPVLSVGLGLPLENTVTLLQTAANTDRKLLLMTEEVMKRRRSAALTVIICNIWKWYQSLFFASLCFLNADGLMKTMWIVCCGLHGHQISFCFVLPLLEEWRSSLQYISGTFLSMCRPCVNVLPFHSGSITFTLQVSLDTIVEGQPKGPV